MKTANKIINASEIVAALRKNFAEKKKVVVENLPGWEVTLPAAPAGTEAYASITAHPKNAPEPILMWWAKCGEAPVTVRILRPKAFPQMREEELVLSVAPAEEPLRDIANFKVAIHAAIRAVDKYFHGKNIWEKFAPNTAPGRLVVLTKSIGEIYSGKKPAKFLHKLNLRKNETPVWELSPDEYFAGFSKELDYFQLPEPAILRWTPQGVLVRLRDGNLLPAPRSFLSTIKRFSNEALTIVDTALGGGAKVFGRFVASQTETETVLKISVDEVYNLAGGRQAQQPEQ